MLIDKDKDNEGCSTEERSPASFSPLDLPELLHNLVQFLDRHTILQASLVSRAWHRFFSPMLFREVRFEDWTRDPTFADQFRKNVAQVVTLEWIKWRAKRRWRELLVQQKGQLEQQQQHCLEDLTAIMIPAKTHRLRLLVVQGELDLRFLTTILPRIPTLTCLRIEGCFIWQKKIGIREIFQCSQSLLSLDCDNSVALQFDDAFVEQNPIPSTSAGAPEPNPAVAPTATPGTILEECMKIHQQSYQVSTASASDAIATGSESQPHHLQLPTQRLRILRLHKISLSDQELIRLVQECPQLEELFLHQESNAWGSTISATHQWNWFAEFVTDLSKACPKLVRLHLTPGCFQSLPEEILLKVLEAFPRLHTLEVPYSQFSDRTMCEILRTRAGTPATGTSNIAPLPPLPSLPLEISQDLQKQQQQQQQQQQHHQFQTVDTNLYRALTSIDISRLKGIGVSSTMLQTFMERSPQLMHFRGDEQMIQIEDMVLQDVGTLRPWACTQLETLIIGFQYYQDRIRCCYGRSYSEDNINDKDMIVYQQLSRLTRLRTLSILKDGPACKESSGLRTLSALQVLQSFRIPRWDMDATSQSEQLDAIRWMAQTWICLQELHLSWAGNTQQTKEIRRMLRDQGRTNIEIAPIDDYGW
ncbi:hypothetical protein BGZ65_008500 [Modicella reniformis]|uniref:F-box domain-containing protein n=1 Tax=Modicella reniformis TaxID=1440133 RepID=A0A9P6MKR6_9FUNG|nr:hypothetical protein BGZ65_008500 [Modicella reniformis]